MKMDPPMFDADGHRYMLVTTYWLEAVQELSRRVDHMLAANAGRPNLRDANEEVKRLMARHWS